MPNSPLGLGTRSHYRGSVINLIGLWISGDIGEYSCYTDRYGRKVFYYYTPPAKPPSPAQVRCRARFAESHRTWKSLTDLEKLALEDCSRKLSLRITGKNIWMSASLTHRDSQYLTLQRQSGITLPALIITANTL